MRIQEAVRSTLVSAAASMNLTQTNFKSVRIDQDRLSQDGLPFTATTLTVGPPNQSMILPTWLLSFMLWE